MICNKCYVEILERWAEGRKKGKVKMYVKREPLGDGWTSISYGDVFIATVVGDLSKCTCPISARRFVSTTGKKYERMFIGETI